MANPYNFDLSKFEVQSSVGIDALFKREPSKPKRKKIASLNDLTGFIRLSNDTLIHKADRDLWAIQKQPDGTMYVERMFDDDGSPLKV
jgi:hypothetical protein